ncbi:MAG: Trk system potassium transporter TrkA [Thermoguttaceae bacterium]|nr:Trk system potassium transporter TrkA [Thermoguttaceae bacterium]
MKALILGGGTVGSTVAESLCKAGHKVTVVDRSSDVINQLRGSLDIRGIVDNASSVEMLIGVPVGEQDVCLALTSDSEVNLVASSIAKGMGAKRVAARVYADLYRSQKAFNYRRHFHIDALLGIEHLTAMEILRQIRDPDSMIVEHFAQGNTEMQEITISQETKSTGIPLEQLKLPGTVRIGSIKRDGAVSIATAADTINPGDRVSLLGEAHAIEGVKKLFDVAPMKKRTFLIAGAGEVALYLAEVLVRRKNTVNLIERNMDHGHRLSAKVPTATVLYGDARRRSVLAESGAAGCDYFIGATNDDETNIMCCIEARSLGAKSVIAVVHNTDYGGLVEKLGIDATVSPHEMVRRQVEGLLHPGPLTFVNPYLLGYGIEIVELTVQENSPVTEAALKNCGLPRHSLLASVVRDLTPQLPDADFRLRPGDTAVALVHKDDKADLVELFSDRKDPLSHQKGASFNWFGGLNEKPDAD